MQRRRARSRIIVGMCLGALLVVPQAANAQAIAPSDVPWSSMGPQPATSDPFADGSRDYGPISGRVTSVVVDPADASGNAVYIGTAGGGVWRSTNAAGDPGSVSWSPLSDHEATLVIGALALQPGNSSMILAGTGEGRGHEPGFYGLGILRSEDGGQTWTLIPSADGGTRPFRGLGFSAIAFSSDNPDLVVAAASATNGGAVGALIPGASTRGLYASQDGGQSWQLATLMNGATTVPSAAATDVVYSAAAGRFFAAIRGYGLYSSSDGLTWQRLITQPGGASLGLAVCAPPNQVQCPMFNGTVAVRPGTGDLFVWYADSFRQSNRMFRSSDHGASWTELSRLGIESCGDPEGCGVLQSPSLYLAAVPNGLATELYGGATNIFKCHLNDTDPTCSSVGAWKNLTHALGCAPLGAPAKVHPGQQAMAFLPALPQLLYFASSGGMYRSSDAAGLQSGSCTQANPFQNLNAGLGPLAQVRSLAQDAQHSGILLAAVRDGSVVALDPAQSGTDGLRWSAVRPPPGGSVAINPTATQEWYAGGTGASLSRCTMGSACRGGDFASVIGSAQLGGDTTAQPVRFILDPQAPERVLVGTCRVWRGPATGAGWSAANLLSPNFESGAPVACQAGDANQVRALAVGGAVTAAGSQVIYAGTGAGRIFVTTNAAGGPSTWSERTGGINPQGYAVADIALDPTDASGHTAYVALLGFGSGRIFKTSDAGVTWSNVTGDLVESPVGAVLVDPLDSSIVYAGTDGGVFLTTNGGVTWTRYGRASGTGALPRAPVTALVALDAGPEQRLRAATWGRGVWEADLAGALAPAYFLAVDAARLTSYPGFPQSFSGRLTAVHGYDSDVILSCEAEGSPLPASCSGETLKPTPSGAPFALAAHDDTPGDYHFNILAAGADAGTLTRRQGVTLNVVDFALSPPTPDSITVSRGATSSAVGFTLSAAGSFAAPISLACAGLPAGAACNFLPGGAQHPTSSAPLQMSVTITTTAATPAGTYSLKLVATAAGAPYTRERSLELVVASDLAMLDLSLSLSASSNPALLGHGLTYTAHVKNHSEVAATGATFVVTAAEGMNILSATPSQGSCSGTANLSCALGSMAAGGETTISIMVAPAAAGSARLAGAVSANESDVNQGNNTASLQVAVSGFTLAVSPSTLAVAKGQGTAATVTLQAQGGAYGAPVELACSGLPAFTVCRFLQPSVVPGGTQGSTDVFVSTAPATWLLWPLPASRPLPALVLLAMVGMLCVAGGGSRRRWALLVVALVAVTAQACGGGPGEIPRPSSPGTPTGVHVITITGKSGTAQQSGTITLTVN